MVEKTLFEKIRDEEIPAEILHRDDACIAFHDIAPQAPTHILVVPCNPIPRIGEASVEDSLILGHLLIVAAKIAREQGIEETGYRVVINHGRDGGESVPHLHVHVLGGRPLQWPPG